MLTVSERPTRRKNYCSFILNSRRSEDIDKVIRFLHIGIHTYAAETITIFTNTSSELSEILVHKLLLVPVFFLQVIDQGFSDDIVVDTIKNVKYLTLSIEKKYDKIQLVMSDDIEPKGIFMPGLELALVDAIRNPDEDLIGINLQIRLGLKTAESHARYHCIIGATMRDFEHGSTIFNVELVGNVPGEIIIAQLQEYLLKI